MLCVTVSSISSQGSQNLEDDDAAALASDHAAVADDHEEDDEVYQEWNQAIEQRYGADHQQKSNRSSSSGKRDCSAQTSTPACSSSQPHLYAGVMDRIFAEYPNGTSKCLGAMEYIE